MVPTLLTRYREQIAPSLRQEFGYANPLQAPKVVKVVLNIGIGKEVTATSANPNIVERASADLAAISGQKPVVRGAKKAIAGFKLRAGQPVGVSVTLRGDRMYSFLERLLLASLPRIRDFRGASRDAFDGRGNYALGIREQIIFPEIEYGQVDRMRGLQVNIITSAKTDREAFRLLELMGMPFARDGAQDGARRASA
ncbi:MAG: 50S ribosomal protein L5 [Dehalococcoidia bacterium]|nr:50S ribosomal protein L5 [Dehalococcoidia bacterium]